jgi:hypothetical protein
MLYYFHESAFMKSYFHVSVPLSKLQSLYKEVRDKIYPFPHHSNSSPILF